MFYFYHTFDSLPEGALKLYHVRVFILSNHLRFKSRRVSTYLGYLLESIRVAISS